MSVAMPCPELGAREQAASAEVPPELRTVRFALMPTAPGSRECRLVDLPSAKKRILEATGASSVRIYPPGASERLGMLTLVDLSVWLDETGAITSMRWN